jgi:hypothetical protein
MTLKGTIIRWVCVVCMIMIGGWSALNFTQSLKLRSTIKADYEAAVDLLLTKRLTDLYLMTQVAIELNQANLAWAVQHLQEFLQKNDFISFDQQQSISIVQSIAADFAMPVFLYSLNRNTGDWTCVASSIKTPNGDPIAGTILPRILPTGNWNPTLEALNLGRVSYMWLFGDDHRYYTAFVPIFSSSGEVIGALGSALSEVDFNPLLSALNSFRIDEHGYTWVIDANGNLVNFDQFSNARSEILKDPGRIQLIVELSRKMRIGDFELMPVGFKKNEKTGKYLGFFVLPKLGWTIGFTAYESDFQWKAGALFYERWVVDFFVLLVSIVLMVVLAYVGAKHIAEPFNALALSLNQARNLPLGQLPFFLEQFSKEEKSGWHIMECRMLYDGIIGTLKDQVRAEGVLTKESPWIAELVDALSKIGRVFQELGTRLAADHDLIGKGHTLSVSQITHLSYVVGAALQSFEQYINLIESMKMEPIQIARWLESLSEIREHTRNERQIVKQEINRLESIFEALRGHSEQMRILGMSTALRQNNAPQLDSSEFKILGESISLCTEEFGVHLKSFQDAVKRVDELTMEAGKVTYQAQHAVQNWQSAMGVLDSEGGSIVENLRQAPRELGYHGETLQSLGASLERLQRSWSDCQPIFYQGFENAQTSLHTLKEALEYHKNYQRTL